jgi:hypothetical protein
MISRIAFQVQAPKSAPQSCRGSGGARAAFDTPPPQ